MISYLLKSNRFFVSLRMTPLSKASPCRGKSAKFLIGSTRFLTAQKGRFRAILLIICSMRGNMFVSLETFGLHSFSFDFMVIKNIANVNHHKNKVKKLAKKVIEFFGGSFSYKFAVVKNCQENGKAKSTTPQ